jgi:hypothetical protein
MVRLGKIQYSRNKVNIERGIHKGPWAKNIFGWFLI